MCSKTIPSLFYAVFLTALFVVQGCASSGFQAPELGPLELNAKGERQRYQIDKVQSFGQLSMKAVSLDVNSPKGDTGLHIDFYHRDRFMASLVINDEDCIGRYSARLDYIISQTTRLTYYYEKPLFWGEPFDLDVYWDDNHMRVVVDGEEKVVILEKKVKRLDLHLHKGDLQIENISLKQK